MSTLNARLILTDHSPLPVPEHPCCEGLSQSVGCDAFFVGLSTLADDETLVVMYKVFKLKEKCGVDT